MTFDLIEKFVENDKRKGQNVKIHFKTRSTICGRFIETKDYRDLKLKNFWRIVPESRMAEWEKTKDQSLSRMFNGGEFTRLTDD